MLSASALAGVAPRIDRVVAVILPLFLLVDWLNGALLQYYGSGFGLAAVYKLALLALMALSLLVYQPKWLLALVSLLLVMLLGPALHWPKMHSSWIVADMQLAVKAISPLLALGYLTQLLKRNHILAKRLIQHSVVCSSVVLLINFVLGALGVGGTAYQPLDGVAQSFLGFKGLFYSTNELSAVLLLITGILLYISWQRHVLWYALCSLLALAMALSLLTKTGILGISLLIVLVPLLLQPAIFWRKRKTLMISLVLCFTAILLLLLFNLESLLRALGIYDKLSFVYQQRGLSGILLSSRDYYASLIWQSVAGNYSLVEQYLGVGQGGVAMLLKKYFAEMDWFDLFTFYGVAGGLVYLLTFSLFLYHSWQLRALGAGRVLILVNLLMLLVSTMAGHILSSGMVWLPWALANAMLLTLSRSAHERSA